MSSIKRPLRDLNANTIGKTTGVVKKCKSDHSDSKEDLKTKFTAFTDAFLDRLFKNPDHSQAIQGLAAIKESDFSEEDPLLLVVTDVNNADSVLYFNAGNYGLNIGAPGYRVWPGSA